MSIRILVVWETFPRSDFSAGDRRFITILELLARRHRVDYVAPVLVGEDRAAVGREALQQAGVNVLASGWSSFARALLRRPYDIVLFEFYTTFKDHSRYVRERQPCAVLLIDSVDVHFAREAAGISLGLNTKEEASATRQRELAAYRAADAVIVVTDSDAEILKREGRMPPLFIIPIVIPIRARPERTRAPEVLFVGGFRHPPNVDGVRWFASDIWPRIREAVPQAVFNIVGRNPPAEISALATTPGVRVLGYVPDTTPFLDEASVSVAPLRYGAGMKGKVNEALASGVPLVTTSFGVQGTPVIVGVHAIVADRADDFAAAVVTLLKDPDAARTMAAAGQELARIFSPERIAQLLESMLKDLVPHPGRLGPRLRWLGSNVKMAVCRAKRAVQSRFS